MPTLKSVTEHQSHYLYSFLLSALDSVFVGDWLARRQTRRIVTKQLFIQIFYDLCMSIQVDCFLFLQRASKWLSRTVGMTWLLLWVAETWTRELTEIKVSRYQVLLLFQHFLKSGHSELEWSWNKDIQEILKSSIRVQGNDVTFHPNYR